jgi:putative transposase
MRKPFTSRLYPNQQQQRLLVPPVEACRWRYNHRLAERRDAWAQRQESRRRSDQHATLPALKMERPSLAGVQSQVVRKVAVRKVAVRKVAVRKVAVRVDLAFQVFVRRVKASEQEPGAPRVRGEGRYDSLIFPPGVGRRYVGIDVGVLPLAARSTGEAMANPHIFFRRFRREEQALAKGQRRLSQEEKGTPARAR